MTFAFSDLLGLAWILAFPVFLHIINAFNGRNRGITAPRTEPQTRQYIKIQRKRAISQPEHSKLSQDLRELRKAEYVITHKPLEHKMSAPVTYTPEVSKPAVTLARDWAPICCILPAKAKPAPIQISTPVHIIKKVGKFLKARKSRISLIIKPDKEELKTLRINAGYKLKLTWIELAWLKTHAVRRGIDDWISLIDSKLSYGENKLNIAQQYGAQDSDGELMQRYKDSADRARDYYKDDTINVPQSI